MKYLISIIPVSAVGKTEAFIQTVNIPEELEKRVDVVYNELHVGLDRIQQKLNMDAVTRLVQGKET